VGCFEGHGLPKASQQPEEIPCESSRDPPGDSARGDSISRLEWRQRAAILSDIIVNEKLIANYLAQKVDVLFNFPSRSHCTCNRIYGKTRYITPWNRVLRS
jgi:hypothetical protein